MPILKVSTVEIPNQEGEDKYYCGDRADIVAALVDIGAGTGVIELKSPNIPVTSAINISNSGGSIVFNGNGSVLDITGYDISCFNITAAQSVIFNNVGFEGGATDNGLGIYSLRKVVIGNCTFNNIETAIQLNNYPYCNDSIIFNNFFTDIGSYGILMIGDTMINGLKIYGNRWINESVMGTFLYGDYCRYGNIHGNYIYNAVAGINYVDSSYFSTISENVMINVQWGILISFENNYSYNNSINGNFLINCDTGIFFSYSDRNQMMGNSIHGSLYNGIRINDPWCDENIIVGNEILDCGTAISNSGTNTYIASNNIA